MAKIYVHKWVLSNGKILEIEGEFSKDPDSLDMFRPAPNSEYHLTYFHKGDYSLTKIEAVLASNERKRKKIASLQKQIEKLNNLNFSYKVKDL